MNPKGLTLLEVIVIIVVIAILASLLLPVRICEGRPRMTACADNLHQLHTLGSVYASTHRGAWPDAKGEDLWLFFTRTTPPLLSDECLEVLACPVRGEALAPGQSDYRGPRQAASTLKPSDALGGDKAGNHGDEAGGNILLKDGSVQEYERNAPLWETLSD